MLYNMQNPNDQRNIAKYGKAYGTVLLHKWLPNICRTRNLFVFDSYEDYKKIEEQLPEIFVCRADAKVGDIPTFRVEGTLMRKEGVAEYIKRVKQSNPNGVVLCTDNEEWTREKIRTDGAFNVYFYVGEKISIDFLGKGFDMGAITKGKESHEVWNIDWDDILFVKPNGTMNQYRDYIISQEKYLESARRRIEYLLQIGYTREQIKGKIPKYYIPMQPSLKEKILDEIIFKIYEQIEHLTHAGLKSFGVQGMIIDGELYPIEINRQDRFAPKSFYNRQNKDVR